MHASIPYAHAEGIQNEHLKNRKTDAHAEHARKELMRALSMRVRNCSGCASGTAQGANFARFSGQLHANQGFGSGSGLDPDPGWQKKNYPQK